MLDQYLVPGTMDLMPAGTKGCLIIDNAPSHMSKRSRQRYRELEPFLEVRAQPAASPDLSPLDWFFWSNVVECAELRAAVLARYGEVAETVGPTLARIHESFYRRCQQCIKAGGGHFELS